MELPEIILVADDWTVLGVSVEQSKHIDAQGWAVVWAQRPITSVWFGNNGYELGENWEWRGGGAVANGFYAAGPIDAPLARDGERTLGESWRRDGAYRIERTPAATAQYALDVYRAEHGHRATGDVRALAVEALREVADVERVWLATTDIR